MPKGIQITKNTEEYILNIPMIQSMGFGSATLNDVIFSGLTSEQYENIKSAVEAYAPSGGGGSYSDGYADGSAAMENTIASSQAITANLYKSKLASEDATIAAADATDIDGQGTIFSESYSYLKTSVEMQDVYDSGYSAGETDGEATGYTNGYSAGYSAGEAAAAGTPFTKSNIIQQAKFYGSSIWSDGSNIYLSRGSDQYILDTTNRIFTPKLWTGLTSFDSRDVWSDGTYFYYSNSSEQYVLDAATSTWSYKTWNSLTRFDGRNVWSDGTNIYFSDGGRQYVLDTTTSTWSSKTWTGTTYFTGTNIWSDGTNIYLSASGTQKVLDTTTSTWSNKSWDGDPGFYGYEIWSDGTDIYYSSGGAGRQCVLDKATSTWSTKTWNGLTTLYASGIWSDGSNIYYSYETLDNYVLDIATSTWTLVDIGQTAILTSYIFVNGTKYEFSDIDMSFKPASNNP